MNATITKKEIAEMTVSRRIELAKGKIQRMVDDLIHHISLHENNALISYSPLLTDQIPRSYAANAFNVVQESIHRYEIIRLCTFWDGIDLDKHNIPTAIELVDDPRIVDQIVEETEAHWTGIGASHVNPDPDPAIQAQVEAVIRAQNEKWAKEEASKAAHQLQEAISAARKTIGSQKLTSVMNLRHKHLAHRLSETREEKREIVAPMKFGDEKDLLEKTINIVDGLHLSINGSGFDWDGSREIARKNAASLWQGCTFKVLK